MEKRVSSLTDPRWVEAISTLIHRSQDRYFRWHDSGDLQDIEHLQKIIQVCKNLPLVRFWLPTREYQTVEAYRRDGGEIPRNLCIRYSTHLVDGVPPLRYGLPVSTVYCRACWNPAVRIVTYELKWASPESRGATQTD